MVRNIGEVVIPASPPRINLSGIGKNGIFAEKGKRTRNSAPLFCVAKKAL